MAIPSLAQVPNGGFENWTTIGIYQDPNGWITLNSLTTGFGATSCERAIPGAMGAAYAKVNTVNLPGIGIMPGIIISGDLNTGMDGFPHASRPGALNGQWKYAVSGGDEGFVTVFLSRWNASMSTREEIGYGLISAMGSQTNWSTFSIPITYVNAMDPDTATITILSSSGTPVVGSYVGVDDLSFGPAVGIEELSNALQLDVHPSPASTQLFVNCNERMLDLTTLDMSGRTVMRDRLNATRGSLDVSGLDAGQYTLQVRMADGRFVRHTFVKN